MESVARDCCELGRWGVVWMTEAGGSEATRERQGRDEERDED